MRRRSKAGGEPAKVQRRKTLARKSRVTSKAARPNSSSAAREETKVGRLTRELNEALEQRSATADVLKAISRSTFDLTTVLNVLVELAARLCKADKAQILLPSRSPHSLYSAASFGYSSEYNEYLRTVTFAPGREGVVGRVLLEHKPVQIADVLADPDYRFREIQRLGQFRTHLGLPLLREGHPIGVLLLSRVMVRPFDDKHIELLTGFADQAVIAIENARLLNELRQRTDDLSESLEQQTATAEVLRVISSSPGDLRPVFEAMLENAVRICNAKFGNISRWDGQAFHLLEIHNAPPAYAKERRGSPVAPPHPKSLFGGIAATKSVIHFIDCMAEAGYLERVPSIVAAVEIGGVRTALGVPMLREDELIGAFTLFRQEVRPFSDKQIELVQNFAAQAVIAIENTRLLNELRELLQQQIATADVLKVVSSSPGDLQPVFTTMLENASRICDAKFGNVYLWDGDAFRLVAAHNTPVAFAASRRHGPFRPKPSHPFSRMVATKQVIHVADAAALPEYIERDPEIVEPVELGGVRTCLAVPMLKENEVIGALIVYREEVRTFTDKQIALITNFAAQAVIAIENTRLLNELRQRTTDLTERTADLTEALEQQTATSEVLGVISGSPGDLQPVFEAMLEKAARICDAMFGNIYRWSGEQLQLLASHNTPPAFVEARKRSPLRPGKNDPIGRMIAAKTVIHVPDAAAERAYSDEHDPGRQLATVVDLGGARTILAIPMLRENELIGAFTVYRQEVRPFTERQISVVSNFAAQAVVAIENARLLNELKQSLGQQTATANVLEVISRAAFDLRAVFDTVAESSVRLCGADQAFIYRFDGEMLRMAVAYNTPPAFKEFVEQNPIRPGEHTCAARTALRRQTIHIPDILADPEYTFGSKAFDKIRTVLGVPILKGDNDLLGVMIIYHQEVKPFTANQIALVETFADQAAIAIENVRLLDELRQRTDELGRSVGELRALGEVSQAINSTLELEIVLSTIVANAVQLSGTEAGAIYVFDDERREFRLHATYGMDRELIDALAQADMSISEPNIALIVAQRDVIQVSDLRDEPANVINEITLRAGFRARLTAPLMRGEDVVGLLVVRRRAPGTFPQNTIDLIKTFAAQSAVAIENARLFQSVQTSLDNLRTTQDRLVQTQKLASLGQLTAGIAHEIKNPLNFVNNFSSVSTELLDELQETLGKVKADASTLGEIAELTSTLRDNLDKIVQHGKRADSIVKNMLLHSREGSGEHRPVDINALVEEAANLAYHGARAEKPGFKINIEQSFDPAAGQVDVYPQEITRALLNLISNGFYAATKHKEQNKSDGFEPSVMAATKNLGDKVEIRIRDNGIGIPPEVKEKMFNPFFTTKPAGEGTGLGLSITHDIIVKQHSGSIEVGTQPGEFTEIRIILPRSAAHF